MTHHVGDYIKMTLGRTTDQTTEAAHFQNIILKTFKVIDMDFYYSKVFFTSIRTTYECLIKDYP